jgi:hypothetical protein
MPSQSVVGYTPAYFFDWTIILLTVLEPFVLPPLARLGTIIQAMVGLILISLGLFLGILFLVPMPLDWQKHWLLSYIIEFVSLLLLPLSVFLYFILPPLYVLLGVEILHGRGTRGLWSICLQAWDEICKARRWRQ